MTPSTHAATSSFLLVGNGSYLNRGCEAIAVSTVEILRATFGQATAIDMATYAPDEILREQSSRERDPLVHHRGLGFGRFSLMRVEDKISRTIGASWPGRHRMLLEPMHAASAVLEVGGDNYSLDYDEPWQYLAMDNFILSRHKPLFLWGASVGPFTSNPAFEKTMGAHLRQVRGIFARESLSVAYLKSIGVSDNVHLVADPAFMLTPRKPEGDLPDALAQEGRAIAVNLSPLVASFGAGGLEAWLHTSVEAVALLVQRFGPNVVLVAHVFQAPWNDDYKFLSDVAAGVFEITGTRVPLLRSELTAAEIKWCLARCRALVGARTHATIAALSSGRPTLSIAYSMKARGINIDTLGTADYCLPVNTITPESLLRSVEGMLDDEAQFSERLQERLPVIKARSLGAGRLLADAIA